MPRIGKKRNVQADEIGFSKKAITVDKFGAQILFDVGRRSHGVAVKNSHLKSLRAPCHTAPDSSESHNAERLAPNVSAEQLIKIPPRPGSRAHPFISFEQAPGNCHQERPGKIRGRVIENARRIRRNHVVLRAGGHIDVVEADRNRCRDAKFRRGSEKLFIHFFGEQADKTVLIRHTLQQFASKNLFAGPSIIDLKMSIQNLTRRRKQWARRQNFRLTQPRTSIQHTSSSVIYTRNYTGLEANGAAAEAIRVVWAYV